MDNSSTAYTRKCFEEEKNDGKISQLQNSILKPLCKLACYWERIGCPTNIFFYDRNAEI